MKSFHIMTKPNSAVCNLDCTYCFYLEKEKLYSEPSVKRMKKDILEKYVKDYIDGNESGVVSFSWQGGEPTLSGIDFFKEAVELQNKYSNGKKIENTFQTNGVLLNDEWCEFFKENNFLVGLSIDGPEEIHDIYRFYKGGQPSFKKVMNGIELLHKNNVDFNTLTCVHKENANSPLKIYNFLKKVGSGFIQFIPIVERKSKQNFDLSLVKPDYSGEALVTEWSVDPLQYGKFLSKIFDEWVRNDVGKYFVQIFDVSLSSWFNQNPPLCIFRETCGDALALEFNGDVYSCDHYVYPENKIGNLVELNIKELVNSEQQIKFGEDKKNKLPKYCRECDYLFACNGECPKKRFSYTPDGEHGLNYLCAGYKYFFNHIDPYMKFMSMQLADEQPPVNVMKWVREKDLGFPKLKLKRNDLCACGSGKKYKNCCGS